MQLCFWGQDAGSFGRHVQQSQGQVSSQLYTGFLYHSDDQPHQSTLSQRVALAPRGGMPDAGQVQQHEPLDRGLLHKFPEGAITQSKQPQLEPVLQ